MTTHDIELRSAVIGVITDVWDRVKQVDDAADEVLDLIEAALQAQPTIGYVTRNEEGDPAMLFFDPDEARLYCELGEEPEKLVLAGSSRLNAASIQPELVAVALATCDAVDDLIEKWYATRESGCLPNQVVRAKGASKLLRAIALEA